MPHHGWVFGAEARQRRASLRFRSHQGWLYIAQMGYQFRTDLGYPEITATTLESGERTYHTRVGNAPSVTTILSTLPHPELDAWRERVGHAEADRITKEAQQIGTHMHNLLEAHVLGHPYTPPQSELQNTASQMFQTVRMFGLRGLGRIWGCEVALHLENFYAGRTDLIGEYARLSSIIDYKTGLYAKKPFMTEKYKLQISAYRTAHHHMFPGKENRIRQGVILVGIRPNPQFNKPPEVQKIIITEDELDHYEDKWMEVLYNYYEERSDATH